MSVKISNFIIAQYMTTNAFSCLADNVFQHSYQADYRYDKSFENLLPVVQKIHSEHRSTWASNEFGFKQIREAFANLNTSQLYKSILNWIKLDNKRKQ